MNRILHVAIILILFNIESLTSVLSICSPKYRLSTSVRPTFYSIKIQPFIDKDEFRGEVFMHIKIKTSVDFVEFHANKSYLSIKSIYFDSKEVESVGNSLWCQKSDFGYTFSNFELMRIVRKRRQLFPPGSHVLYIKYEGKFSNTTAGIFKTVCNKDGVELNRGIATDLQPHFARQVFPCFDEPAFKAKFQLTLIVPNNSFIALSNMRAKQIYNTAGGVAHKFESTPLMSIYLLSFAVTSRANTVSYTDDHGLPFSIYSCEDSSQNDTKLLKFSSKVINFYTNYTHFNYTLPKVDFLGFHREETAATENWGLVTFNTSLLSSNEDVHSDSQKKSVIAHELAHFWFGNLVTNEWWDDIWLHESFATFMALKAEESILNNDAPKSFPIDYSENLYYYEYKEPTTAVINFQEDPVKIRENFNDVTYVKGACILRMLEATIGEEKLQKVFIDYIRKHAFAVVTTDDFLNIVTDTTADNNVREFLETYLYQNQFPVIKITENEENYVLHQITLNFPQQTGGKVFDGHKWTIPIRFMTDQNACNNTVWFYKDMENLQLPKNNSKWIKLNCEHVGYYRVVYSNSLWNKLMNYSQELDRYERDHLLFDAVNIFEINMGSCEIALKYLWKLSEQEDFNTTFASVVYLRIKEILRCKLAIEKLKIFFGIVMQRAGGQTPKSFLQKSIALEEETHQKCEHVTSCVEWLLKESPQYYSNVTKSII